MQELTGQMFLYKEQFSKGPLMTIQETGSMKINPKLIPIRFTHDINYVKENKENRNNLIILIRNPLEAILRNYKAKAFSNNQEYNKTNALRFVYSQLKRYIEYIKIYDNWDKNKRQIIYYEDFIFNPKDIMRESITMLNYSDFCPDEVFKKFFLKIDVHKSNSIKNYNRLLDQNYSGSYTEGNTTLFHSKDLSPEFRKKIYRLLLKYDYKITQKYLKRYF